MTHEEMIRLVIAESDAMQPQLTELRRSIHRYPETGWLEMRTTTIITDRLKQLGYEVLQGRAVCRDESRMGLPSQEELEAHAHQVAEQEGTCLNELTEDVRAGFTGAVGILRCGEGPVVAMRFDIDALGLIECPEQTHRPTREGFASRNHGMMHACGHDAHVTIGLGTAAILAKLKDELHGTVKLIFQPAEEGARGARAIVDAGHLDDVDFFLGTHVAPTDSLDDGDCTPGTYGSLATTKYDVTFRGRAAHAGGQPEQGRNALVAAASAVMGLYAIPRHSGGQSRVNVGRLVAGTGRNVIPDTAFMQLEVRGDTTEINEFMMKSATAVCEGAAAMQGCTVEMKCVGMAEGQRSDPELLRRVGNIVRRDLPQLRVSSVENSKNWGSEDISVMMNRVQSHGGQATYMRTVTPMAGAQHTVTFDMDETVLVKGVQIFCAAVIDLMGCKP